MLFRSVSFALKPHELLHVVGANGSGKSSLLRIACGLLEPSAGEVRWNGAAINGLHEDYSRGLAYVGHADGLNQDLTASENLRIACVLSHVKPDHGLVTRTLAALALDRCAREPVRTLSQGQRRRAAIARLVLAEDKPLWLLDEPFSALDASAVEYVSGLVETHCARGGMVIMTTHDRLPRLRAGARELVLSESVS